MNGQTLDKWDRKPWRQNRYRDKLLLQTPVDLWLFEELFEQVEPKIVVEVGVLDGGFSRWLVDRLDLLPGLAALVQVDIEAGPTTGLRRLEGDSVALAPSVFAHMPFAHAPRSRRTIVILDDDHTPSHVLAELDAYSQHLRPGDWIVVCDTVPVPGLEAAVRDWVASRPEWAHEPRDRFGLSNHRGGWLRKIAEADGRSGNVK